MTLAWGKGGLSFHPEDHTSEAAKTEFTHTALAFVVLCTMVP